MYENIAKHIQDNGGIINLNTELTKIITREHMAAGVVIKDKLTKQTIIKDFDIIVSTDNFKDMLASMDELPTAIKDNVERLEYRSTIFVYVEINPNSILNDQYCYVLEPKMHTGRYTNFASWSKDLKLSNNKDMLVLEYWCKFNDGFWNQSDKQLSELAINDLMIMNCIDRKDIYRTTIVKYKDIYPFYPLNSSSILDPIYDETKKYKNLYFIGRCGTHKYNNQDHSILMGLLCADRIKGDDSINVWAVNTDPTFQEERLVD